MTDQQQRSRPSFDVEYLAALDRRDKKRKQRPEMGQWCITTNQASKRRTDLPKLGNTHHSVKWQHRYVGWKPAPVRAMYVGYRLKREGIYWEQGGGGNYDGDDAGWEQCFRTDKTIEVWMFVASERTKPFPVFPQDVTLDIDLPIEEIKGLQS